MNPTLDPTVVNLARAIRQTESGGDFNAKGKSGEMGAYQFTPDTWNATAPKYGINVPLEQASPEQQNAVAYNRIKAWKDAGNDVTQIASMWNAGEKEPDAYTGKFSNGGASTGVNKFGARFDVPTYAKSVASAYLSLKNGGQVDADPNNPSSTANETPPTTPPGVQPNPSGTGTNDVGLPKLDLGGAGGNESSTAVTSDENTLNDVGNVAKGFVSGTFASGKDIAAAIGGNTMAKTFEALPQADQQYLTNLIQLRNKAATAKNKDETAHFNNLIKNYKTSDGQDIASVFPALNKSTEQVLGDFASMGLEVVGGAEGAQALGETTGLAAKTGGEEVTKSFGKKLLSGATTGAEYGGAAGASGAMQNNAGAGDIAKSTAIGAATGAVVGAGTEALVHGAGKAFSKSLTREEILAVKPEDVDKLSLREQKEWHQANSEKSIQAAKEASEKSVEESKNKITEFSQKLADTNEKKRVELKEPFKQLMRDSSDEYKSLAEDSAKNSPNMSKTMTHSELGEKIDSKFEHDPQMAQALKDELGIKKEPVLTEEQIANGEKLPEPKKFTNQQLLDKARAIMSDVSSSAKGGNRTYTSSEYEAMKKYSFIMETLGENGVDMSEANKFWREWAPVRERGIRAIQPFDESNVKKGSLGSTLNKSVAVPTTPAKATAKLDAQNFIKELETRMKLPEGSLNAETQGLMDELEKAKLGKADAKKVADQARKEIMEELKNKKYNIKTAADRNALIKSIIKRAIGAAIGYGAGKAVGGTAGSVIGGVAGEVIGAGLKP